MKNKISLFKRINTMVVYDIDAQSHGIGSMVLIKVCIDYSVAYVRLGKNS